MSVIALDVRKTIPTFLSISIKASKAIKKLQNVGLLHLTFSSNSWPFILRKSMEHGTMLYSAL